MVPEKREDMWQKTSEKNALWRKSGGGKTCSIGTFFCFLLEHIRKVTTTDNSMLLSFTHFWTRKWKSLALRILLSLAARKVWHSLFFWHFFSVDAQSEKKLSGLTLILSLLLSSSLSISENSRSQNFLWEKEKKISSLAVNFEKICRPFSRNRKEGKKF